MKKLLLAIICLMVVLVSTVFAADYNYITAGIDKDGFKYLIDFEWVMENEDSFSCQYIMLPTGPKSQNIVIECSDKRGTGILVVAVFSKDLDRWQMGDVAVLDDKGEIIKSIKSSVSESKYQIIEPNSITKNIQILTLEYLKRTKYTN